MRRLPILILTAALALVLTGCTASPAPALTLPKHARAYFFGDSWTGGYSAGPGKGFAWVTSERLGWRMTLAPDGSGTGYVYSYGGDKTDRHYPERVAALPKHLATDVVILEGGLNDQPATPAKVEGLQAAAEKTIDEFRARTNAPIVVVGPAPAQFPYWNKLDDISARIGKAAAAKHALFISPLEEHWITAKNVSWVIDSKTGHPGTRGHAYYARRLAADIRRLLGE